MVFTKEQCERAVERSLRTSASGPPLVCLSGLLKPDAEAPRGRFSSQLRIV